MDSPKNSWSGELPVTVKPNNEWNNQVTTVKEEGDRRAKQLLNQGHRYVVEILAPKEVLGGDTVPVRGVVIEPDWRIITRLEMVEAARELITKAYIIGSLDPAFPTALASIIEGKGLYEYSIGEFFQLYGKFEGKYQLTRGRDTKTKMEALINGDERYLKPYTEHGEESLLPLPYAVRNILAHTGSNPNTLDPRGSELRTAIELLRSWVA